MQEWLNAILTTEWLLGASMGFAGKRLITWVRDVINELRETDVAGPGDDHMGGRKR